MKQRQRQISDSSCHLLSFKKWKQRTQSYTANRIMLTIQSLRTRCHFKSIRHEHFWIRIISSLSLFWKLELQFLHAKCRTLAIDNRSYVCILTCLRDYASNCLSAFVAKMSDSFIFILIHCTSNLSTWIAKKHRKKSRLYSQYNHFHL